MPEKLSLNSGRNCLAHLIRVRAIRALALPDFICDTVVGICREARIPLRFYEVGEDLRPRRIDPLPGETVYLVNYFGQLSADEIAAAAQRYPGLILDNVQAFFVPPLPGTDTLYSCRKYFEVPDGAYLYTAAGGDADYPRDDSSERLKLLADPDPEERDDADELAGAPIRRMSPQTETMLREIPFEEHRRIRRENFRVLHSRLKPFNRLSLQVPDGAFMYPFLGENGPALRERLREELFVPELWPEVRKRCSPGSTAYRYSRDILTLPVDPRYDAEDMEYLAELVINASGRADAGRSR